MSRLLLKKQLQSGHTVSAMGVEYALAPNRSAFIEYDYMSFDKSTIALDFTQLAATPAIANVDVKNKLSVAKIGLNYKFGGPDVGMY